MGRHAMKYLPVWWLIVLFVSAVAITVWIKSTLYVECRHHEFSILYCMAK